MVKVFQKDNLKDISKAVVFTLVISIVCVLLYAIVVKFLMLSDTAILIGNTVIKLVSILLGTFFAFRHAENGVLKGVVVGISYAFLSHFVFSALSGSRLFAGLDLLGCLFCAVVGAISGIIAVNVRK